MHSLTANAVTSDFSLRWWLHCTSVCLYILKIQQVSSQYCSTLKSMHCTQSRQFHSNILDCVFVTYASLRRHIDRAGWCSFRPQAPREPVSKLPSFSTELSTTMHAGYTYSFGYWVKTKDFESSLSSQNINWHNML